jgi:hypothetical protein
LGFAVATPTATPMPGSTATPIPVTGPWVTAFGDIVIELNTPDGVSLGELVLFHLALGNAGDTTRTFYHGTDLAEFIVTKDGEHVITSHNQLAFGDIRYTNELGPGRTRRYETGFTSGLFEGVLIDGDRQLLPVGEYEVYGIARMRLTKDGEDERFMRPPATIRIVRTQ